MPQHHAPRRCGRVMPLQAHSFELEEPIKGEVAYTRGGLVVQVKEPKQLSFRPLADVRHAACMLF